MNMRRAEECVKIATHIAPGKWQIHANFAHILNNMNRWQEAKEEAIKAIHFSEGMHYEPHYNLGVILANLGDHAGAIKAYQNAIRIKGDVPNLASYNISSSLLLMEQYEEGWKMYENRFTAHDKVKAIRDRFQTLYESGKPTKGKTIYVFSEQGVGDLVNFSRYLPKLKSKTAAHIVVEAQESVANLIADNFDVDIVPRKDGIWPDVPKIDYAVSVCSLPGIFKAGIEKIPSKPYLKAPEKELPEFLKSDKFKVGICWAGNADHVNDYKRSMHLRNFLPLTNLSNIKLFSLQKNCPERKWAGKYINLWEGVTNANIVNLSPYLVDYSDTAYYISQMDLIITIDTSIVHLAGALGKATWLLLDAHHDWRWGLNQSHSIWYPSVRIFKQKELGKWDDVFTQVMDKLTAYQNLPRDQILLDLYGKKGSKKRRSQNSHP